MHSLRRAHRAVTRAVALTSTASTAMPGVSKCSAVMRDCGIGGVCATTTKSCCAKTMLLLSIVC